MGGGGGGCGEFITKSVNVLWTPVKSRVTEIKVCTNGIEDNAVHFEPLYLSIFQALAALVWILHF
jgi:hypothetical protein